MLPHQYNYATVQHHMSTGMNANPRAHQEFVMSHNHSRLKTKFDFAIQLLTVIGTFVIAAAFIAIVLFRPQVFARALGATSDCTAPMSKDELLETFKQLTEYFWIM